ncbi:MAG: 50S ribosomal protein L13 [Robiginitomaculum sp.]
MKTTKFLKTAEVEKKWILLDAKNVINGRLASFIAMRLRGKHRPNYTPHIDCGDHVVVINCEKIAMTGKKRKNKVYYKHTGYVGSLKEVTADKVLDGRFPERVLKKAVQRMLPKESPLARKQFANLHIYAGTEHKHDAQKPEIIDFAALNPKNTKVSKGA